MVCAYFKDMDAPPFDADGQEDTTLFHNLVSLNKLILW